MSSATRIVKRRGAGRAATTAAAASSRRRNLIATFPSVLATNPYQRLLYDALREHGFAVAPPAPFELGWIVRAETRGRLRALPLAAVLLAPREGPEGPPKDRSPTRSSAFSALRLAAARLLGYRVIWTIHQILPHEIGNEQARPARGTDSRSAGQRPDRPRRGDARRGSRDARRPLPARSRSSRTGPISASIRPAGRATSFARSSAFGPDAFVFLCFGDLRTYKEVETLLEAFASTALPRASLVVAGTVRGEEHGEAVRSFAARDRAHPRAARVRPGRARRRALRRLRRRGDRADGRRDVWLADPRAVAGPPRRRGARARLPGAARLRRGRLALRAGRRGRLSSAPWRMPRPRPPTSARPRAEAGARAGRVAALARDRRPDGRAPGRSAHEPPASALSSSTWSARGPTT